ncbi:MAG: polysaccharide deacetylase family protein [Kiloniellales bacterium]|nr:polysaccharide deacetylase family protein [Kiloniellales bacterium]
MNAWSALDRELELWQAARRQATVWWRDDDAVRPGPALDRLFELSARHGAPLALAVIPATAEPALAQSLMARREGAPPVAVLQHGYAHRNHEPEDRKKCELGAARPAATVLAELASGRDHLGALFGTGPLPVLVPPWNRIAAELLPALPGLGFRGLSAYTPRDAAQPVPELLQANCHVDPIRWKPERSFLGEAAALELLCGHLAARRAGRADPDEPSGILTHHAVHDEALWHFLDRLLATLSAHPAVRLLTADAVFDIEQRHERDVPLSA